ncbi:MAG TPA: protein kinase [Gemmatimonas sp.]|nr:protein kinase [Gemmatimonas sp.]
MPVTKICPRCGEEFSEAIAFCANDGTRLVSRGQQADLIGSIVADRYRIVSSIGEGGMGQVYLAEHVRMKRKSAIKIMRRALVHDVEALQRFTREAENASQIAHPNVAAIFDFGETTDGLVYLAMEYVDGESLAGKLARDFALHPDVSADILRQAADALQAAHDLGILHRDLKPDNIMLGKRSDGTFMVKLVDFGIARTMDGSDQKVTRTGFAIGTPAYMSPEQLAGDSLDARSDQYSLALVAFMTLTGKDAFPAESSKESLIARLTSRPRTLQEAKEDVQWPAELQQIFDRALSPEPTERFTTVSDFAHALSTAISAMTPTQTAELYRRALDVRLSNLAMRTPHSDHVAQRTPNSPLATVTPPAPKPTIERGIAGSGGSAAFTVPASGAYAPVEPSSTPSAASDSTRRVAHFTTGPRETVKSKTSKNASAGASTPTVTGAANADALAGASASAATNTGGGTAKAAPTVPIRVALVDDDAVAASSSGGRRAMIIGGAVLILALVAWFALKGDASGTPGANSGDSSGAVLPPPVGMANTNAAGGAGASVGPSGAGTPAAGVPAAGVPAAGVPAVGVTPVGANADARPVPIVPGAADSMKRAKSDSVKLAKARADSVKRADAATLVFPGDAARAFVGTSVDVNSYTVRKDDIRVTIMSPPVTRWRADRARAWKVTNRKPQFDVPYDVVDPVEVWSGWKRALNLPRAVYVIEVAPSKAAWPAYKPEDVLDIARGHIASAMVIRDGTMLAIGDVGQVPAVINEVGYERDKKTVPSQVVGTLPPDAFIPRPDGKPPKVEIVVVDKTRPTRIIIEIPERTVRRLWDEFHAYRTGLTMTR